MPIGRRTRRRGALDKALAFAHARAARLAAAPPLPSPFGPPRAGPLRATFSLLARDLPWPERGRGVVEAEVVVVVCEGCFFGGDYELCEEARRKAVDSGALVLASDVFVERSQLERAQRAGADGVAPVMAALSRESPESASPDGAFAFADIAAIARELGLELVPECSTPEHLRAARAEGAGRALVSLRDRDTFRPALDVAKELVRENPGLLLVGLFADSLPEDLRTDARALGLDALAC